MSSMQHTHSEGAPSLALRSSESQWQRSRSSPQHQSGHPGHTYSGSASHSGSIGPVTMETGSSLRSQQVFSPMTQTTLHKGGQEDDVCCKGSFTGTEMATVSDPQMFVHRLPQGPAQFAPSGVQQQVPENVLIQKQHAQEAFYSQQAQSSCSLGSEQSVPVSSSDTSSMSGKGDKDFISYPVQETSDIFLHSADSGQLSSASSANAHLSSMGGSLGYSSTTSSFNSSGPQPTSNIDQPSADWKHDPRFIVSPEDYLPRFKEGHFDCVLIYSEGEDVKMALNFKDIITNVVTLEDGCPPKICILDRNDNLHGVQSRFRHADEAMNRSTYMFLFLTKEFVNDSWAEIQKDECLMSSIQEPEKKWCVVPLHTKNKRELDFRYPYGLRALKGVDISAMLPGQKLEHINPRNITRDHIDRYFLDNITRMFNIRLRSRREREREQERDLQRWIYTEQERRMQVLIEERHKQKILKMKHEQEQANMQRAMARDEEQVRQRLAQMSLPNIDSTGLFNKQDPPRQHSMPQTDSGKTKDTLMMMLALGMKLEDAVSLLHQQQTAVPAPDTLYSTPGVPFNQQAVPPTYQINNYGNLQVGEQNRQDINKGHYDGGTETSDEGIVYDVEETPDVQMDSGTQQVLYGHRQHDVSGPNSIHSSGQLPPASGTHSTGRLIQAPPAVPLVQQDAEYNPSTANPIIMNQVSSVPQPLQLSGAHVAGIQSPVAIVRPQLTMPHAPYNMREPESGIAESSLTPVKVPFGVPLGSELHEINSYQAPEAVLPPQSSYSNTNSAQMQHVQAQNSRLYQNLSSDTSLNLNLRSTQPDMQTQGQGHPNQSNVAPTSTEPSLRLDLQSTPNGREHQGQGHGQGQS